MIEPGDKFQVSYGNGHTIEVVALSMRQKRKVMELVDRVSKLETSGESRAVLFEIAEDALKLCVPGITDETLDRFDETMAMQIVGATLGKQAVDNEEQKKSESPL